MKFEVLWRSYGVHGKVREITDSISLRQGRYGDYIYYKTAAMSKPQFFNLKGFESDCRTCEAEELKKWLLSAHGIE